MRTKIQKFNDLGKPLSTYAVRADQLRNAARKRRHREADVYGQVRDALPVSDVVKAYLDKGSMLRLVIHYLKARRFMDLAFKESLQHRVLPQMEEEEGDILLDAMNSFLMVLDMEGTVHYVSQQVDNLLQWNQVQLMGSNIKDLLHKNDHQQFQDIVKLSTCKAEAAKDDTHSPNMDIKQLIQKSHHVFKDSSHHFTVRMKRHKQKKDLSRLKHVPYIAMEWRGRLYTPQYPLPPAPPASSSGAGGCVLPATCGPMVVAVCSPIMAASLPEVDLPAGHMFLSRHRLDGVCTYVDKTITDLLGYESSDILNTKLLYYHCPLDARTARNLKEQAFTEGTSVTPLYKFYRKDGSCVWMQTRYMYMCTDPANPFMLQMNYVIDSTDTKVTDNREANVQATTKNKIKKQKSSHHNTKSLRLDVSPHISYVGEMLPSEAENHSPTDAELQTRAPLVDQTMNYSVDINNNEDHQFHFRSYLELLKNMQPGQPDDLHILQHTPEPSVYKPDNQSPTLYKADNHSPSSASVSPTAEHPASLSLQTTSSYSSPIAYNTSSLLRDLYSDNMYADYAGFNSTCTSTEDLRNIAGTATGAAGVDAVAAAACVPAANGTLVQHPAVGLPEFSAMHDVYKTLANDHMLFTY